jgi:hypothetical protein
MTDTVTGEGDKERLDIQFQETVDGKLLASPFRAHVFLLHSSPDLQIPPFRTPPTPPPPLLALPQAISSPCLSSLPPSLGVQALLALPILPPTLAAPPPSPSRPANSSRRVGRAA